MQTPTTAAAVAREVRAELGRQSISGAALGRHLGLSQPAIYRRLHAEVPFDVDQVQAIAQLFGVPLSQFLPELAS